MLENRELVDSLTKDMSNGVKRLVSKRELLDMIDEPNMKLLSQKIGDYNPKSAIGRENRDMVIKFVNAKLAEFKGETVDLKTVSMIEEKTSMLTIQVPQPGFHMCINTRAFIEKTKDPKAVIALDTDDEGTDFDYKRHTVVQKLFGKDYVRPLISNRAEFFSWLKIRAIPSSLLAHDRYLIPHQLLGDVIERIEKLEVERNGLLDEFEAKYEEAIADAKEKLGIHFDRSRYPDFADIRVKFDMYFRVEDTRPAEALKKVGSAAYKKEQQRAASFWQTTLQESNEALCASLVDLVGGFADSMGNDEDGKPKIFHAAKVEKLKEFLSTFDALNLTDNSDLGGLAGKAKELLSTVDPKALRKDVDLRAQLATEFGKIKEQASEMVVSRGRKVRL